MRDLVDLHVHLQLGDMPPMGHGEHRLSDYQAATRHLDLARFGVLAMALPGDLDATQALNDAVLAVSEADSRAFALCSVHPYDGEAALAEVDRVAAAGAKGIKLHPNTQSLDVADQRVAEVVRRAEPASAGYPS